MKGGVEPEDDADSSRTALQINGQTCSHCSLGPLTNRAPLLSARIALQPSHRQAFAARLGEQFDQIELGIETLRAMQQIEIIDQLHDPMVELA